MDKLEAIRKIVSKYDDANVTSSVPNNIEIGGLGSSKSKALSELMKILSIDRSELMCCGDAANDNSDAAVGGNWSCYGKCMGYC